MHLTFGRAVLRVDAIFLLAASTGGFLTDLAGAFLGIGPQATVLGQVPHAAIGFVEAHGLAFIIAVLLWRAAPERPWHLAAAGVHVLLGVSNLVFWPLFVATDMLVGGYVTTGFHGLLLALQLWVAMAAARTLATAPA